MHDADAVTVLARADRVGRPLTSWSAASLWRLCSAAGITLTPQACGSLRVDGPRSAVSRLAPALAMRKKAILRGACMACGIELATKRPAHCSWCFPLRGKRYAYTNLGARLAKDEERFLRALATTDANSRDRDDVSNPASRIPARKR
jgi:hypothetical protein